jgi:hypothetical protein
VNLRSAALPWQSRHRCCRSCRRLTFCSRDVGPLFRHSSTDRVRCSCSRYWLAANWRKSNWRKITLISSAPAKDEACISRDVLVGWWLASLFAIR